MMQNSCVKENPAQYHQAHFCWPDDPETNSKKIFPEFF